MLKSIHVSHFWGVYKPLRFWTPRPNLAHPYRKSDPSEYRFGAVWLKVRATLRPETRFGPNGALAAAWCPLWTQGLPRLPGGTATTGFAYEVLHFSNGACECYTLWGRGGVLAAAWRSF